MGLKLWHRMDCSIRNAYQYTVLGLIPPNKPPAPPSALPAYTPAAAPSLKKAAYLLREQCYMLSVYHREVNISHQQ